MLFACAATCWVFPSVSRAQPPDFSWVRQFGGPPYTFPQGYTLQANWVGDLGLDRNGNVLIVGNFIASNPNFAGPSTTNFVPFGTFLVKYDPAGSVLYTKSITTNGMFAGVKTDLGRNIFVTGYTNESYFSNGLPQCNMLLTKHDSLGNALWTVRSKGDSQDEGVALAVDAATNVYMTGMFTSSNFMIGSILLTNDYVRPSFFDWKFEEFIAKFDPSGKVLWAHPIYGVDTAFGLLAPKLDSAGNVIIAGTFANPLTLGNVTLTNIGTEDIFLAKYDATGNLLWAKDVAAGYFFGGTPMPAYADVDSAGNIYLGGTFQSPTATFGNVTITNQSAIQIFLAKLDANGNVLWIREPASPGADFNSGAVFADGAGNVYQTSYAWNNNASYSIDLGGQILNSSTNNLTYTAKYDGNGNIIWGATMYATQGSIPSIAPGFITGDAHGNIYLAGNFSGGIFGNLAVPAINNNEAFLAKLDGPRLSLQAAGNQVVISWPTNATGLSLESTSDLAGNHWSPVTNLHAVLGDKYVLTNSVSSSSRFYRLRNF